MNTELLKQSLKILPQKLQLRLLFQTIRQK